MYKIGTKSVPKAQFTEPQGVYIFAICNPVCVYAHKGCDIAHTHCRGQSSVSIVLLKQCKRADVIYILFGSTVICFLHFNANICSFSEEGFTPPILTLFNY